MWEFDDRRFDDILDDVEHTRTRDEREEMTATPRDLDLGEKPRVVRMGSQTPTTERAPDLARKTREARAAQAAKAAEDVLERRGYDGLTAGERREIDMVKRVRTTNGGSDGSGAANGRGGVVLSRGRQPLYAEKTTLGPITAPLKWRGTLLVMARAMEKRAGDGRKVSLTEIIRECLRRGMRELLAELREG